MASVIAYSLAPPTWQGEGADRDAAIRAALASFGVVEEGRHGGHAVTAVGGEPPPGLVLLRAAHWLGDGFDLLAFDDQVWRALDHRGRCEIRVLTDSVSGDELLRAIRQVATRYQRHTPLRNAHSSGPLFDKALAAHARLHDRSKPLVAADHDHALDTWCWVLRLAPEASLALQLAALFHDVERLQTESEVRVEQHATDYISFKAAHAAAGGRLVAEVLRGLGIPGAVVKRTQHLVTEHEARGQGDADAAVLNEADALSFFSLNASGFLKYYGAAHTAHKVAYTWARLGPTGRRELDHLKLAAPIRALLAANRGAPHGGDEAPHHVHDREQQGGAHHAAGNGPSA